MIAMNKIQIRICVLLCLLCISRAAVCESRSIEDLNVGLLINERAELMGGTRQATAIRMFREITSKSTQPYIFFDVANFDMVSRPNSGVFGLEAAGFRFINFSLGDYVKYDVRIQPSVYKLVNPFIGFEPDAKNGSDAPIEPVYSFLDAGIALTFFNSVVVQADGTFGRDLGELVDLGYKTSSTSLPARINPEKLQALHLLAQVRNPSTSGRVRNSFFKSDRLSLTFDVTTGNKGLINNAGSVFATGLTFLPYISYRYSPVLGEMFVGGSFEVAPEWGWYLRPTGNAEIAVLHPFVRNAYLTLDAGPLILGGLAILLDPVHTRDSIDGMRQMRNGYSKMKSPDKYASNEYFYSMTMGPTVYWGQQIDSTNYPQLLPYTPESVLLSTNGIGYGCEMQNLLISKSGSMCLSIRAMFYPQGSMSVYLSACGPKN
jgi:hypothetical protein